MDLIGMQGDMTRLQMAHGDMMNMHGSGMGFGMGAMLLWSLVAIVALALVIVGVVVLLRAIRGTDDGSSRLHRRDKAVALLRERFARGEIESDEFEARLQRLHAG
jgi:putative membrane protein